MNILFLIPSLANGGQEKAGMKLCNYLMQFHNVTVVCLEAPAENEFDFKAPVHRIILPQTKNVIGKILNGIRRKKALQKIKQQVQPAVSIAFGNTAIILNAFSKGPDHTIASVRQSLQQGPGKLSFTGRLHRWLYGIALKRSNQIVTVSSELNKELKTVLDISNNIFIYNGCDPKELNEKASLPLPGNWSCFFNDTVIGHMGRFDMSKCTWNLVKSFCLLKEELPAAKLLLIGAVDHSNPINENIYRFCIHYLQNKKLKVVFLGNVYSDEEIATADVLIAGHQMNPFPLLKKASIFAFPSAWEGFPNALLEAMALGLPVISADCQTGPREILTAGNEEFGFLLPVFDEPFDEANILTGKNHYTWASTLKQLLTKPELKHLYSKKALERVAAFDNETVNKAWLKLVESNIT